MDESLEKTVEESVIDPEKEDASREGLVPANWMDLVIYLGGGIGLYFLSSVVVGILFPEVSLPVVTLIATLNFLILAGSVVLFGVLRKKLSWASLGLIPGKFRLQDALIGAGLAIAILPLRLIAGGLGLLIEKLVSGEINSLNMREDLLSVGFDSWYGVLLMVVGIGILAPIAEELFFRGLIYDFFRQKTGVIWAVALSSVLFGLAHFDSLAVVLSSFVMAVFMALSVERTRSLWMTIWMHITTNTGAVLVMALLYQLEEFLPNMG